MKNILCKYSESRTENFVCHGDDTPRKRSAWLGASKWDDSDGTLKGPSSIFPSDNQMMSVMSLLPHDGHEKFLNLSSNSGVTRVCRILQAFSLSFHTSECTENYTLKDYKRAMGYIHTAAHITKFSAQFFLCTLLSAWSLEAGFISTKESGFRRQN